MDTYPLGDACLCWSFAEGIDRAVSALVLYVYGELKREDLSELGVLDVVPTYNSLAVHFDPQRRDLLALERKVSERVERAAACFKTEKPSFATRRIVLPVRYDGEDLQRVADHAGLSVREVVELHRAGEFTVAMIGFRPYFPYLIGLDPRLETPRLDSPRTRVPAGAVAIGGAQTGIYPEESPGGWNLIGSTDPERLKAIRPGDVIVFEEVAS